MMPRQSETTAIRPQSRELAEGGSRRAAQSSGRMSRRDALRTAEQLISAGGTGNSPIDANPALVDAGGPQSSVPGPGVDVRERIAAIRLALDSLNWTLTGLSSPRRENVILLFTDLVSWTDTASRLEPEDADGLRRQHFAALRQAIRETGGTEVKSLGDGSMVVFLTASAAISCAVVMQQLVDDHNRSSGHRLGLRIGVSGGEVTREGFDFFGDPVIQASRLCSRAASGEILVRGIVTEMAGRWSSHLCRSRGDFQLKGLPEPVEVVEVLWATDESADSCTRPYITPGARAGKQPIREAVRPG